MGRKKKPTQITLKDLQRATAVVDYLANTTERNPELRDLADFLITYVAFAELYGTLTDEERARLEAGHSLPRGAA